MLLDVGTGARLDVVESGDRANPSLLLICGTTQQYALWGALSVGLAEHYHVISFNHRGIGESLRGDGPLSMASMARDAAAVLDAVGVSSAHVLGWSLGTAVAQELVLAEPDKVDSLVLWGTWPELDGFQACGLAALRYPWTQGNLQVALASLGLAFSPELLNSPDFGLMMQQMLPLFPQTEEQMKVVVEQWDADMQHNTTDRLPGIDKPTLVIGGEQDLLTPPWQCRKVAELIPGAKLKIFEGPGSSHALGLERTEEFLAEVLPFLAEQHAPAAAR
ncbi:alpha/beta fold hydrolase [Pseudonocardia spinosispora]|uniref:alpha/beta fold hydrolase n=1 Tax=Pseudonocardia spinosispora TaxID=103441 RepID=UPI00040A368B|nr:alpha/beta fold hydrolase [Pseudonocardia spinosispora]